MKKPTAKILYEAFVTKSQYTKDRFYKAFNLAMNRYHGLPHDPEKLRDFFPHTEKEIDGFFHRPGKVQALMMRLDELCGSFGVEYVQAEESKTGRQIEYLNMGDPYIPTVVYLYGYTQPIKFLPGGWGDLVK